MRLVADQDIIAVESHFSRFGVLETYPGREINRKVLQGADVLLVRSVTEVNKDLLQGSGVSFVASATSGMDHVDIAWLTRQGIQFVSAPGSNANAVLEYCLVALTLLSQQTPLRPETHTVGIVGGGQVGSRLARFLLQAGFRVWLCDPLLEKTHPAVQQSLECAGARFCELDECLQQSIVSLHVPLIRDGDHPTWHLIDKLALAKLKTDAILINTSRGAVVDNTALLEFLRDNPGHQLVLDVWEGEPSPNIQLLERVTLATPHIAGYSLEAKIRATAAIADALADYLGQARADIDGTEAATKLEITANNPDQPLAPAALLAALNLEQISQKFKQWPTEDLSQGFDLLRKAQVNRRECLADTFYG